MSTTPAHTPSLGEKTRGSAARLPVDLVVAGHSARMTDMLISMFLVYRVAIPGIPIPPPQLAAIVLIGFALFRRPTRSFAAARWYPVVMPLLIGFLALATWYSGGDPSRRAINIAVLVIFAGLLASGRIDVGSVAKGLGLGLVLNAVLFYAGIAPDNYQGRLTGFLEDKNASALVYAVGALLLAMVTRRMALRILVIAAGAVALIATDSRTTMAAYAVAVTYLLLSRWLNRAFQLLLLTGGFFVFVWADDNLSRLGDYALERAGSDAFRMRIDEAAWLKTQAAPWYGSGLGQATVDLDSGTWFFHNSYHGLIVEGGLVLLVVLLAAYAITGLGLSNRVDIDVFSYESRAITAATLVLAMCAFRLGEVFLAPIGFLVLGIGLARLLTPIEPTTSPRQ